MCERITAMRAVVETHAPHLRPNGGHSAEGVSDSLPPIDITIAAGQSDFHIRIADQVILLSCVFHIKQVSVYQWKRVDLALPPCFTPPSHFSLFSLQGGGIPRSQIANIWNYMYTTAERPKEQVLKRCLIMSPLSERVCVSVCVPTMLPCNISFSMHMPTPS